MTNKLVHTYKHILYMMQMGHLTPLSFMLLCSCFILHVFSMCKLFACSIFPLSFVSTSLYNLFTLFTFTKLPSSTVPQTLHFHTIAPSQRLSELLNWPVSEAELEQALFPSAPELPAQTAKRELKIIEFMRKKDPRTPVFSGNRR